MPNFQFHILLSSVMSSVNWRWVVSFLIISLEYLLNLPQLLLVPTIFNILHVQIILISSHKFELVESKLFTREGVKKILRENKIPLVLGRLHMISYYMMCCDEINIFISSLSLTFLSLLSLSLFTPQLSLLFLSLLLLLLSTINCYYCPMSFSWSTTNLYNIRYHKSYKLLVHHFFSRLVAISVMGRSPCCDKVGLKKGPWTPEEDQKLLGYIKEHGHGSWRALPAKAGAPSLDTFSIDSVISKFLSLSSY